MSLSVHNLVKKLPEYLKLAAQCVCAFKPDRLHAGGCRRRHILRAVVDE